MATRTRVRTSGQATPTVTYRSKSDHVRHLLDQFISRGIVTDNLIYYLGDDFPGGAANVGDSTDAESFQFARNWWYRADRPAASRQPLPSVERGSVYGRDPGLVDATAGDFRLTAGSPAIGYGASADVTAGLLRPSIPTR